MPSKRRKYLGTVFFAPFALDAEEMIYDHNGKPKPMYFHTIICHTLPVPRGDAIYEDINNDGTIDELDIVYLGTPILKYTVDLVWTSDTRDLCYVISLISDMEIS